MKSSWFLLLLSFLLCGCDKGYQARFSNLYVEPIDTVLVGASGVEFTNIDTKQQSNYQAVKRGNHSLRIVTKSGKIIIGSFPVPNTGSGKYTIQVDGVKQISILQDPN